MCVLLACLEFALEMFMRLLSVLFAFMIFNFIFQHADRQIQWCSNKDTFKFLFQHKCNKLCVDCSLRDPFGLSQDAGLDWSLRMHIVLFTELTLNPPEGILAGPINEENFFEWEALIT